MVMNINKYNDLLETFNVVTCMSPRSWTVIFIEKNLLDDVFTEEHSKYHIIAI